MTGDRPSPLVPRLRFPEFRDGSAWLAPRFADLYVCKRTNSLSRKNLNYESGTIKNIHYGDIHNRFRSDFRLENEHVPYVSSYADGDEFDIGAFCEEGDIVLADASEDLDDVGKAIEIVSLGGESVVAGTHTILASRRGDVPVLGFGGKLFRSAVVRSGIRREAHGAKVYGISPNRISPVPVPLPPTKAEQRKIADCLGSLDDQIDAESQKLEALRRYKRGLMQQLFPAPGETRPRLRFPDFQSSPDWRPRSAGSLFRSRVEKGELGLPLYSVTISRGMIDRSTLERNINDIEVASKNRRVHKYDITYNTMRMWQGACGLAPVDCMVSPAYVVLALESDAHSPFFEYLFRTSPMLQLLTAYSRGLTKDRLRLYYEDFSAIPLVVPEKPEQTLVAECLSSCDRAISAQETRLVALSIHLQGLLQQLFPSLEEEMK